MVLFHFSAVSIRLLRTRWVLAMDGEADRLLVAIDIVPCRLDPTELLGAPVDGEHVLAAAVRAPGFQVGQTLLPRPHPRLLHCLGPNLHP